MAISHFFDLLLLFADLKIRYKDKKNTNTQKEISDSKDAYGRKTLLSKVKRSISGADKPNANFVYIYGESGIGKSSILSKLAWELRKK